MEDFEGGLPAFANEILDYLTHHPGAADTVQGILQWWLHQDCDEQVTTRVQNALDFLVNKGWLTQATIPAPKVYRMDETRMAEIEAFLRAPTRKRH